MNAESMDKIVTENRRRNLKAKPEQKCPFWWRRFVLSSPMHLADLLHWQDRALTFLFIFMRVGIRRNCCWRSSSGYYEALPSRRVVNALKLRRSSMLFLQRFQYGYFLACTVPSYQMTFCNRVTTNWCAAATYYCRSFRCKFREVMIQSTRCTVNSNHDHVTYSRCNVVMMSHRMDCIIQWRQDLRNIYLFVMLVLNSFICSLQTYKSLRR